MTFLISTLLGQRKHACTHDDDDDDDIENSAVHAQAVSPLLLQPPATIMMHPDPPSQLRLPFLPYFHVSSMFRQQYVSSPPLHGLGEKRLCDASQCNLSPLFDFFRVRISSLSLVSLPTFISSHCHIYSARILGQKTPNVTSNVFQIK